ncbi:VOC family protein [Candidatus Binatia bacterium]|nr:VOC family protein [Candidatus Binatia bacterium]
MTEQRAELVRFDAVRVATDDLARATRAYALLLGTEPERKSHEHVRFALARGAVELVHGVPGAQSLRLTRTPVAGVDAEAAYELVVEEGFGGIGVAVDPCPTGPDGRPAMRRHPSLAEAAPTAGGVVGVDHVVVNTADPERAIRLWRDGLGVRLALDREFPQRGLRMLFFRSAGVTLEFVSALAGTGARGGDDVLDGIAYRVADLGAMRARLATAGLDVSEPRTGNKQGTRVATVRSGTEGVPTLLIEADAPPAERG